ncbi:hypothetical protein GBAR_LOCUS11659 [Geodia barretti]|uniref:Uncharacterized protein n=1 Tax=Geodia barretti TaxID=519541 RepID=A0AA35RYQ5_GEOBA|nr:hypothetical protein GBAR_LOCUS11659 [Geodia barretti]
MRWHVLPGANNMVQYMCLSPQKALQSYAPVGTNCTRQHMQPSAAKHCSLTHEDSTY